MKWSGGQSQQYTRAAMIAVLCNIKDEQMHTFTQSHAYDLQTCLTFADKLEVF